MANTITLCKVIYETGTELRCEGQGTNCGAVGTETDGRMQTYVINPALECA